MKKKRGLPSQDYLVGRMLAALERYISFGANNCQDFWKCQGRLRELMEMLYEVRSQKR